MQAPSLMAMCRMSNPVAWAVGVTNKHWKLNDALALGILRFVCGLTTNSPRVWPPPVDHRPRTHRYLLRKRMFSNILLVHRAMSLLSINKRCHLLVCLTHWHFVRFWFSIWQFGMQHMSTRANDACCVCVRRCAQHSTYFDSERIILFTIATADHNR